MMDNATDSGRTINIGLLVFDEVEILDFCGPFEVFSVTRLDEGRRRATASPFKVHVIAQKPGRVRASGGLER